MMLINDAHLWAYSVPAITLSVLFASSHLILSTEGSGIGTMNATSTEDEETIAQRGSETC
jgi:hypothetical protein